MAMTTNGLIARPNDDTSFVSQAEWRGFRAMVKRAGNVVVGSRTYRIMKHGGDFSRIGNPVVVVVSRDKNATRLVANHHVVRSPRAAFTFLKARGFHTALVAGGGTLNASCMKQRLVDDIYLDIEPVVLGKGIGLFLGQDFTARLKLIGTRRFSPNEIQVHYRVRKS